MQHAKGESGVVMNMLQIAKEKGWFRFERCKLATKERGKWDCYNENMLQIAKEKGWSRLQVSWQPKKGESGVAIMRIYSRLQKKMDGNEYAKGKSGVL